MPVRIPASELYKIQEEDLHNAISNSEKALFLLRSRIPHVSTCSWTDTDAFRPKRLSL